MLDFNAAYDGQPPWDIGRPQPAIVALAEAGVIQGAVLDVGCGTGEQALFLASQGHSALGLDSSPKAISLAREKASTRGVAATFVVGDALDLAALARTFATVIDCGFFHVLSDADRIRFQQQLAAVLQPGGQYIMLCFSEDEPGTVGPRRVSQAEITSTFGTGWQIASITPARFLTTRHPGGAAAWLARIVKV